MHKFIQICTKLNLWKYLLLMFIENCDPRDSMGYLKKKPWGEIFVSTRYVVYFIVTVHADVLRVLKSGSSCQEIFPPRHLLFNTQQGMCFPIWRRQFLYHLKSYSREIGFQLMVSSVIACSNFLTCQGKSELVDCRNIEY